MTVTERHPVAQRAAQLLSEGCVILDFETTGFPSDPRVDVVEIAVIDQRGQTLMQTLVKPRTGIPSGASAVHGIYDRDVVDAPMFPEVYAELARHLSGLCVVAYNDAFERDILKAVCAGHQQPQIKAEWFCAMRGYQNFRGLRSFQKLGNACAREGISVKNAHRALGDCQMTLALLRRIAGVPAGG